jgi:hypothetical protein
VNPATLRTNLFLKEKAAINKAAINYSIIAAFAGSLFYESFE